MGKRLSSIEIVARSFDRIGLQLHQDDSYGNCHCIYNGNRINVCVRDFRYVDEDDNISETTEIFFDLPLEDYICDNVSRDTFNATLRVLQQVLKGEVWCSGSKPTDETESFSFCLGLGHQCENSDYSWSLNVDTLCFEKPSRPIIGKRKLRCILKLLSDAYRIIVCNNVLLQHGISFDGQYLYIPKRH